MLLFFLRWCPGQAKLLQTIKTELAHEAATKRNQTVGSATLQELVANTRRMDQSCYKKKRDGNPSNVLKSSLTLIREGVADELKRSPGRQECMDALTTYSEAMNDFKLATLTEFPKIHGEFVDKFVKLQLRDDVLLKWRDQFSDFQAFETWRQSTLEAFRRRCGVPLAIRLQQQEQTNDNRDKGLRYPKRVSLGSVNAFAEWLKGVVFWKAESGNEMPSTELVVTASLCLLQLACGGRARDVILVNAINKIDNTTINVRNITKRKINSERLEIAKPLLKVAFSDTDSFLDVLRQTRAHIVESAVRQRTISRDAMVTDPVSGILYLHYEKQYDRDIGVETVIQSWSSRMRRLLKTSGHGTHFLRKLYVAASYIQEGESMKEPAWAQTVLGHTQYETSLLYTSVQIYDSNKK